MSEILTSDQLVTKLYLEAKAKAQKMQTEMNALIKENESLAAKPTIVETTFKYYRAEAMSYYSILTDLTKTWQEIETLLKPGNEKEFEKWATTDFTKPSDWGIKQGARVEEYLYNYRILYANTLVAITLFAEGSGKVEGCLVIVDNKKDCFIDPNDAYSAALLKFREECEAAVKSAKKEETK
jgi:hypothetical protein